MATRLRLGVNADLDPKFDEVMARLRAAGRGDLQRNMERTIRRRAQPAVEAVRAAWRRADLPAQPNRGGGKSTGLRANIAQATGFTMAGGALRIRVDGAQVDPAYGTSLVLALNGMTRLRHPTFGRRGRGQWVNQRGSRERFYRALEPFQARWRADVEQVLDDYARRLEG